MDQCHFALGVLRESLGTYFPSELIRLIIAWYWLLLPKLYYRQHDAILIIDGQIQSYLQLDGATNHLSVGPG